MDYLLFVTALIAVEIFNALPSIVAPAVAVVATSALVVRGSRFVNDRRLAMNMER